MQILFCIGPSPIPPMSGVRVFRGLSLGMSACKRLKTDSCIVLFPAFFLGIQAVVLILQFSYSDTRYSFVGAVYWFPLKRFRDGSYQR
jgi:hypothetical protein